VGDKNTFIGGRRSYFWGTYPRNCENLDCRYTSKPEDTSIYESYTTMADEGWHLFYEYWPTNKELRTRVICPDCVKTGVNTLFEESKHLKSLVSGNPKYSWLQNGKWIFRKNAEFVTNENGTYISGDNGNILKKIDNGRVFEHNEYGNYEEAGGG